MATKKATSKKTSTKKSAASKPEPVVTVQVYQDAEGDYRWRGVAGNGKVVSEGGEGYRNRMYAAKIAKSLNASARLEWH